MPSSLLRRLSVVLAASALAACHRTVTVSSPTPAAGGGAMTAAAAMPFTAAQVEEGKTLFATPCQRCHGPGGAGGQNGPALNDDKWAQIDGSYDAIVKIIHSGVPAASVKGGPTPDSKYRFGMRPLGGGSFTDAQVNSLAAYIYSISHK